MDPLLQKFYDFLKEKYGKPDTERLDPIETIHCDVVVEIPGFTKNNAWHKWTVQLETDSDNIQEHRLILGTHWPNESTMWSRYIEIAKYPHGPSLFFKLIETVIFQKEHGLNDLIAFVKVWEEFFETSAVEA